MIIGGSTSPSHPKTWPGLPASNVRNVTAFTTFERAWIAWIKEHFFLLHIVFIIFVF
jgi:hypothetical protein